MAERLKIMIVDDNEANLKLAGDLLEMEGMDVYRCIDAENALAVLSRIVPDLILMDLALPGTDGLQLTRLLKSKDETRSIKIVALTASAMKGDRERIIAAGCDGYITKPIDTRKFKEQVMECM